MDVIVIGAHIDHLGRGISGSSLARDKEMGQIHHGADDNASGVAAMLEIAEYLAHQKRLGKLNFKRDVIFAAWSGEELNLYGSKHYVSQLQELIASLTQGHENSGAGASKAITDPDSKPNPHAPSRKGSIYPFITSYINLDMVGRFEQRLILQGLGSSPYWKKAIERRNVVVQLNLKLSDDTNLPTDAREFYAAGVPILAAFTGSHSDYHSPRDTPEKLKL